MNAFADVYPLEFDVSKILFLILSKIGMPPKPASLSFAPVPGVATGPERSLAFDL